MRLLIATTLLASLTIAVSLATSCNEKKDLNVTSTANVDNAAKTIDVNGAKQTATGTMVAGYTEAKLRSGTDFNKILPPEGKKVTDVPFQFECIKGKTIDNCKYNADELYQKCLEAREVLEKVHGSLVDPQGNVVNVDPYAPYTLFMPSSYVMVYIPLPAGLLIPERVKTGFPNGNIPWKAIIPRKMNEFGGMISITEGPHLQQLVNYIYQAMYEQ